MSLLMGELDSIARCAAQYRSERLAGFWDSSPAMPAILWESAIAREFLRSSWPGGFIKQASSVARQLAVLEEAGFVRRVCCDSDRRVTELYPTEQAEAALPEIRQVLGQWESWVTQDLTQAERRSLELLLGKLKARAAAPIGQD